MSRSQPFTKNLCLLSLLVVPRYPSHRCASASASPPSPLFTSICGTHRCYLVNACGLLVPVSFVTVSSSVQTLLVTFLIAEAAMLTAAHHASKMHCTYCLTLVGLSEVFSITGELKTRYMITCLHWSSNTPCSWQTSASFMAEMKGAPSECEVGRIPHSDSTGDDGRRSSCVLVSRGSSVSTHLWVPSESCSLQSSFFASGFSSSLIPFGRQSKGILTGHISSLRRLRKMLMWEENRILRGNYRARGRIYSSINVSLNFTFFQSFIY